MKRLPNDSTPYRVITDITSRCDRAEVSRTNILGLRHVAAMLALEAVDDPYLVQQRLGHSHVSVTLGIYGYSRKSESVVSEKLDNLLGSDAYSSGSS